MLFNPRLKSSCRRAHSSKALAEAVEPRRLLAAVGWDGGGDGVSWNDPDNWSANALPTAADDVTINVASNPTILLFGGSSTVNSLVSSESLRISSTLTVNTTATLNSPTRISNAGNMTMYGNLTVNDVLTMGNSTDSTYGVLYFQGPNNVTLGGSGSLVSSGTAAEYIYNYTYDGGTGFGQKLTIGASIEIIGPSYYIYSAYAQGSIQNDGLINLNGNAQTSQLGQGNTRFINNGSITVTAGVTLNTTNLVNNAGKTISITDSTLNLSGDASATPFTWDNNGTITANNTIVNLSGSIALADIGTLTRSNGGQVNVAGLLDLASGTLTLDNTKGSWGLASGGRIKNGTIARTGTNELIPRGGILDNITLNLPVKLAQNQSLYVENNLVLNDTLTLGGVDTSYGVLIFQGLVNQTLGGTGNITAAGISAEYIYNYTYDNSTGFGQKLTIGSGIEIDGAGYSIYAAYSQGSIQIDGSFSPLAGSTSQLGGNGTRFINNGTITVGAGSTINSYNLLNNVGKSVNLTGATLNLFGDTNATPYSWDNNGTINANNSIVNLGGVISLADVGTLTRTNGGQVNVVGLLDLAGGTLTLDATKGSWGLGGGGRIRNGTIARTGTNELFARGGIIDNITLNLPVKVAQYAVLYIENNLVLNDILTLGDVDNTYGVLQFQGAVDQTLSGTGGIATLGTSLQYLYNYTYDGGTASGKKLTTGSGIEINAVGLTFYAAYANGAVQNDGPITLTGAATSQLGTFGNRFINNSTITATGGGTINSYNLLNNAAKTINLTDTTFNLNGDALGTPYSWDNNGTINANNSIVNLGGVFAVADVGTLARTNGGQVNVVGLLDLASGTLTLDNAKGSWGLGSGGRIKNGIIGRTGTNTLIPRGGIVDNVTLNLPVMAGQYAALYVENNLVLNDVLTLGDVDNTYGVLQFQGNIDQTLSGTGSIATSGTSAGYFYNYTYEGSTALGKMVTIGSGIELTGRAMNIYSAYTQGAIRNNGQFISSTSDGVWSIYGGTAATFTNAGSIQVSNGSVEVGTLWNNTGTMTVTGGTLRLGGVFGLSSIGTMNHTGGAVNVVGILDLAGGTLTLDNAKGTWGLAGSGVIKNGTIARTASNLLLGLTGLLDNVVLNTPVTISGSQSLSMDHVTINDVVTLGSAIDNSYGQIFVVGTSSQTLGGTGSILAVGNNYAYFYNNTYDSTTGLGKTVTIGSGIEFTGPFGYLVSSYNNGRITIAGTVGSTGGIASALFQFAGSGNTSFVNQGTILASGGGESRVTQIIGNAGNLSVTGAGSVIDITGIYDINQPITVGNDGLLYLRGEWTKSATFDVGGAVVFEYGTGGPSPLNTLYSEVVSGYAGGAWNGAGIKSSRALANSGFALGAGESSQTFGPSGGYIQNRYIDPTAVVVRYTYKGDTNIDGDVDFDDLLKLAQGYGTSGKVWITGDFNYNGLVNFDDLLPLAQNYGNTPLSVLGSRGASAKTTVSKDVLRVS